MRCRYGIDSVGLFAVPAEGPHGFYTIGRYALSRLQNRAHCTTADYHPVHRVVESLARALNNLVERLHASFFLYLLPEPFQFLTVASYLSAPILIGASLTVAGLRIWHGTPLGSGIPALTAVCLSYLVGIISLSVNSYRVLCHFSHDICHLAD